MPNKVFRLIIDMDARRARRGAAEAGSAFGRLSNRLKVIAPLAGLAAAGMAAMFVRSSIRKAIEQEEALALVASQIRATGAAAGLSAQQVAEFAAELQRSTGEGDEAILKSAAVLLSFKQITGDVFKGTLALAQDLAIVMGTDLNSAVLQLSKALADPVSRLGELSRAGIIFTDTQKDLIKELVETNRLVEAQGFILEEIQSQYGGAAVAARDTLGGALRALGSEWGDLQENLILGTGANNPIRIFVEGAVSALQSLNDEFSKINQAWEFSIGGVMLLLADLLTAFQSLLKLPGFNQLNQNFRDLTTTIDDLRNRGILAVASALRGVNDEIDALPVAPFDSQADSAADLADELARVKAELAEFARIADALPTRFFEDLFGPDVFPTDVADRLGDSLSSGLTASLEASIAELPDFIDEANLWEGTIEELMDELTAGVIESGTEAAGKIDWSAVGSSFSETISDALAVAIGNAISSGDVKGAIRGLAAAFGQSIGDAIAKSLGQAGAFAGPLGAVAGAVAGSILQNLLDNERDTARSSLSVGPGGVSAVTLDSDLVRQVNDTIFQVRDFFAEIERLLGGMLTLTEEINIKLLDSGKAILEIGNAAIEFETFEDALAAGLERVLMTALVEAEGAVAVAARELFAVAQTVGVDQVIDQFETLATLTDTLDQVLGNFSLSTDGALSKIDKLRREVEAMGLSAEAAAPFLEQLAAAEAQRTNQLQTGVLDQLFRFFDGTTQFEEERFELAKKKVELEFAIIKAQLQLLNIWDKATQAIFDAARNLALEGITLDTGGTLDVRVVDDVSGQDPGARDFLNALKDELRDQLRDMRGNLFSVVEEIRDLFDINFLGSIFTRNVIEPLIAALAENRQQDIQTQLLDIVKDDPRFAEQFRANQERLIRLEFEKLRKEFQLLDAEVELVNQRRLERNGANAVLIDVGLTWGDLAELWEAALEASLENLDNTVNEFASAIEALQEFRDSLLTGASSPLSLEDQLGIAQSQFDALVAAALAGDAEAAAALPGAANTLLDIASQLFGTTSAFDAIFEAILTALDLVIASGGEAVGEEFNPAAEATMEQTAQQVPIMIETVNVLADTRDKTDRMISELVAVNRKLKEQGDTLARLES